MQRKVTAVWRGDVSQSLRLSQKRLTTAEGILRLLSVLDVDARSIPFDDVPLFVAQR
jgi:hypothetical protein